MPSKFFVQTLNKTGYALSDILDDITKDFVSFSIHAKKPVLEIGAAYGVASLAAVESGATVIINDLDQKHLQIVSNNIPAHLTKQVILLPAKFPEEINLLDSSISAILCCRVIHFFSPEKVVSAINKFYSLLDSGGKVFLTVETPYLKNWNTLPIDFESRKKSGDPFPGYIKTSDYINKGQISDNLPEFMHFFDCDTMASLFEKSGFKIESSHYISRPYFPEEVQLDGRESIGIIAVKP